MKRIEYGRSKAEGNRKKCGKIATPLTASSGVITDASAAATAIAQK